MERLRPLFLLSLLALSPWLTGASSCAFRGFGDGPKASKFKTYSQNAQQLYESANKILKAGNQADARKSFQLIKTQYPFSHYSTLAEIGIADSYFDSGKYTQAADIYKMFSKLHPTHPQHAYTTYRVALSYHKMRPWDWFLVPPSYEKDAATTEQAILAYRVFLQQYPSNSFTEAAKKELKECIQQMAKHELYVARFYKSRKFHQAVVWRTSYLIKKYPEAGMNAEARLEMAKAHLALKEPKLAEQTLSDLLNTDPKGSFAGEARKTLEEIKKISLASDEALKKAKRTASAKSPASPPSPPSPPSLPSAPSTPPSDRAVPPSKAATPSAPGRPTAAISTP